MTAFPCFHRNDAGRIACKSAITALRIFQVVNNTHASSTRLRPRDQPIGMHRDENLRRRAQRQRAPIQGIPYQEVLMVGKAGRVGDRHITIPAVRRLR